ncbi:MAG: hypothetical protein AAF750_07880 [Planctomycetota bacterium]
MNGLIRVWAWSLVGACVVWGGGSALAEEEAVDWRAWGVGHAEEALKLAPKVFFADGEIGLGLVARGDLQMMVAQTLVRLGDEAMTEQALAAAMRTRQGMADGSDRAAVDWARADVLAQLGRMAEASAVADQAEDPVMRLLGQGLYALALGEAGDEVAMRGGLNAVRAAMVKALGEQLEQEGWSDDWLMYELLWMQVMAGDVDGAMATAKAVPDDVTRQESLAFVARGLVEAGRVGEARGVLESVEAEMEKFEAETRRRGGLEACEDCVDVGPIRTEVVAAWAALGAWERATAQLERSDPDWPSEKAEGLALMAVYMTDPKRAAERRLALERSVGLMGEVESDFDRAWLAFWVGRCIARSGDWAAAELLLKADKRPIVKGYAHAGLAWGAMMRVAPKRLGAGLAGLHRAEAGWPSGEVAVMAEAGVDWEVQGRAWALEAYEAVLSHWQGLEPGTVEYSRATSLLEDLAVTQAQLGDRQGVSVSLESADRALTRSHPERSAFLRANGLTPGWRAAALASAYLGDYEDAAEIIRQAESLDWPTGNFAVLVGLEKVVPLARGFRGDFAGMRAGLEPLYVAIQNERDRLPPVVDDADDLFAPADGQPDEPRGLTLSAEPWKTLLTDQIHAGDAIGALERWRTMQPGADREQVRDDLIQGLAEVGAKRELVELVEGMRAEPHPVGLTGLDQEVYPLIRGWNASRGLAAIGHWDEAEPGMREYLGLPIWDAVESGMSMRVGGLTQMALVLVGPEFRAKRLELLEEAMGELAKHSEEEGLDWRWEEIGGAAARLGELTMSERLLAEVETSEGRARVLAALAAGAAERVWVERRKARVD